MFVSFSCGCIGIQGMESRGQTFPPVRLVDCRSDHIEDGELGIAFADDLREKQPSKILTPTEVGEVFKRLRSVIDDGVKFKEIKRLLA